MKRCIYCNNAQPLEWFSLNHLSPDGHLNTCMTCDNKNKVIWYLMNQKREQRKRKRWQENNKELHIKHVRAYESRHEEKVKQGKRDYYHRTKRLKEKII